MKLFDSAKAIDLQLFATYGNGTDTHGFDLNPQKTTTHDVAGNNDLSVEMKTFYSDYLIDIAEPKLVHDQFGQKHPIPANGGKTIEFRKYDQLPKSLGTLQEGVTPDGQKLNVTKLEATIDQYGDYVTLTDLLMLSAIDNNLVQATELIGSQAGRTLDTVTREVINAGTNVRYAGGVKTSRAALARTDTLSVEDIQKAARDLKAQNAEMIDGSWVAIVHPDVVYDLMRDPEWVNASLYAGSTQLFNGEIGRIAGVRFVETTEAKIFRAGETGNNATIDVYSTLIIAKNAYGVTEISGGGLQHIVKQLGAGGTADPLNQRATVGWKATKTAEILVQEYMIRIESAASFGSGRAN